MSTTRSPSPVRKKHHAHHEHAEHGHKNEKDDETVSWFPTPMDGWNEESQSFAPRHEASTIELFFDLWFVGNLATFTAYHAITNRYSFWSYVAFFIILWTSWFHVVCFDARFTSDSVWERACKTVHFCAFAAFSLAGYKYAPVARDVQSATPHWIYRTMLFALLLSRAWLALQYLVTTIMCSARKHRELRLVLPLALNSILFLCVAAICGGLFGGFRNAKKNLTGLLISLYVVLAIEFLGTLTISMIWTKLSFKATHIGERLGLLGLIIIGEGVIGTTKTIVRTMGKNGPTYQSSAQIFSIILILVFMWILYFDKVPRYRFGTVKQQIWMALHLFFHLAMLGVVEGAQQLVQARYILYSTGVLGTKVWYGCVGQHLDGKALASNLTKAIDYFKINESAQGELALPYVYDQINIIGNTTNICSPANTTDLHNDFNGIPLTFAQFFSRAIGAMYQAFDIDIPAEGPTTRGLTVAVSSWQVVYTYFWSSIILLLICYSITSLLAHGEEKHNWRKYVSMPIRTRAGAIVLAIVMMVVGLTNQTFMHEYIASGWLLPTVVLKLWLICLSDRGQKILKRKRDRKQQYDSVATGPAEPLPYQHEEPGFGGPRRRATNAYGYPSHN